MTLVKWNPTRSLITDFDRMLDTIFNDGWNTTQSVHSNSIAVDISENEKEFNWLQKINDKAGLLVQATSTRPG